VTRARIIVSEATVILQ